MFRFRVHGGCGGRASFLDEKVGVSNPASSATLYPELVCEWMNVMGTVIDQSILPFSIFMN